MARRVMVLGGSGMLGSMVVDWLARDPGLEVGATVRTEALASSFAQRLPEVDWQVFEAGLDGRSPGLAAIEGYEVVVNAIGVIKPFIRDDEVPSRQAAIAVNSILPHLLAAAAEKTGARVLQIATDCVFSGRTGSYTEADHHDGDDVYGRSKSLGEAPGPAVSHLRCSIIGPELGPGRSLLEWFLGQPDGTGVNGFTNHLWNGVTTLAFARLCHGVIREDLRLPPLQHVVPGADVDKYTLLSSFAAHFGREDISIEPVEAAVTVNRTLRTTAPEVNASLWRAAGYDSPPGIDSMVEELAGHRSRLGRSD